MIRRPPRSTLSSSSAASDVYKRQVLFTTYGRLRPVSTFSRFGPRFRPEYWFFHRILRVGRPSGTFHDVRPTSPRFHVFAFRPTFSPRILLFSPNPPCQAPVGDFTRRPADFAPVPRFCVSAHVFSQKPGFPPYPSCRAPVWYVFTTSGRLRPGSTSFHVLAMSATEYPSFDRFEHRYPTTWPF